MDLTILKRKISPGTKIIYYVRAGGHLRCDVISWREKRKSKVKENFYIILKNIIGWKWKIPYVSRVKREWLEITKNGKEPTYSPTHLIFLQIFMFWDIRGQKLEIIWFSTIFFQIEILFNINNNMPSTEQIHKPPSPHVPKTVILGHVIWGKFAKEQSEWINSEAVNSLFILAE